MICFLMLRALTVNVLQAIGSALPDMRWAKVADRQGSEKYENRIDRPNPARTDGKGAIHHRAVDQ